MGESPCRRLEGITVSDRLQDPPAPPPRGANTWFWITIGAAAALLVVGVVIAALVSNGSADDAPDPSASQSSHSVEEVEPAAETVEPVAVAG